MNTDQVRIALVQMSCVENPQENLRKAQERIRQAAAGGANIVCLQELFTTLYFCQTEEYEPFGYAEPIPGPSTAALQELATELGVVIVASLFEIRAKGMHHNTAAVIDADGSYLGKYRKIHIPDCNPGFYEKYFFRPGNLGYPVFKLSSGVTIGVYICYDRHFPEGARALGLRGAEIVFNPSATVAGLSQYLWKLEQPAHAVANGYFMGCINRVGTEPPWSIGRFYGTSYFVDPKGNFVATGSEDQDELIVADLDLSAIEEVRRTWQFFRDRRPDTYGDLVDDLP